MLSQQEERLQRQLDERPTKYSRVKCLKDFESPTHYHHTGQVVIIPTEWALEYAEAGKVELIEEGITRKDHREAEQEQYTTVATAAEAEGRKAIKARATASK